MAQLLQAVRHADAEDRRARMAGRVSPFLPSAAMPFATFRGGCGA